jgi:hypothetical protein
MKTARFWFSLVAIFALIRGVMSQSLVTECVHRDSSDRVIYLEREYHDVDTMVYFMAYSDGGRVLKSSNRFRGDTLIEVFECYEVGSRSIPDLGGVHALIGGDEYIVQTSSDSMWVSILDGSLSSMWDTALTLQLGEQFLELRRRIAHGYAALVAADELSVDLHAAKLREMWEYRTLHGRLLNKRILARDGRITNRQDFRYQGDTLIALSYFNADTLPYAVDSIFWNADTTEMNVVNRWLNYDERFEYTMLFLGDSSVYRSNAEAVVDDWVYDRTPWPVRMREAALREGPLCQSRILRARECLLKASRASTGNYSVSEHEWMPDGRLLETVVRRNGRFERRITYAYP